MSDTIALLSGAAWGAPAVAGSSQGVLQVGLTLVDPAQVEAPLPEPSELEFPASRNAVLCGGQGYRECRTPFRGPVTLSREVAATRCEQGRNWGWREGVVWVDGGCAAVFMRAGA